MADGGVRTPAAAAPASPCGPPSYPQPGRCSPGPVPEPGCVSLNPAGEGQEEPPQETPPPAVGRKAAAGASAGQGAAGPVRHMEAAFSPPTPQESGLRASPASFSALRVRSAPFSAWSGALPVSQVLHTVAQRVSRPQGQPQAGAVASHRVLPPTQLDTIRVQVQPEQMKENERPTSSFAPTQCRNETSSQPTEKNSRGLGLNVINPQIIQIQPITECGSQQFLLYNSSEPTVQLLLQRPLHPLGQVSLDKMITPRIINGNKANSVTLAAAESRNITFSACSANYITNHESQRKQKLKKSLKVKTRSGRISRPPKYKALDYKFIKTKDLADCHRSDSDDYSELSIEEDEESKGVEAPSLFGSLNYDLRPKLFKCQTCEKSYIGKGGLARHYKLNADHGQQESSQPSSVNRPHRMALLEDIEKINSESVYQNSSPLPPQTVTIINEKSAAIDFQKNLLSQQSGTEDRTFEEQQNSYLLHMASRRARQPKRSCRPKMAERSRYSGRFNRPSQFPSKSLNNMSAEHESIFRRKARLKELIQQCTNEDFMELAVPRFTALVTVFEFLLMKVGKNYAAKTIFPDVYKEFEELHAMIKKACQDYFSDPELSKVVEIKNHKVAESLGITNFLRLQKAQAGVSPECTHELTETLGQKQAAESSDEILPFAKRTRRESLLENVNINYSRPSGVKKRNCINEGFTSEGSCTASSFSQNRVPDRGQLELLELETDNDYMDSDQICQPLKVESENSQPSRIPRSDHSDNLSSWSEILPTISTEILQEKVMQINSSWDTASKQYESKVCNSVASEVSGLNPDLVLKEKDNEKCEN